MARSTALQTSEIIWHGTQKYILSRSRHYNRNKRMEKRGMVCVCVCFVVAFIYCRGSCVRPIYKYFSVLTKAMGGWMCVYVCVRGVCVCRFAHKMVEWGWRFRNVPCLCNSVQARNVNESFWCISFASGWTGCCFRRFSAMNATTGKIIKDTATWVYHSNSMQGLL